jgi:hypothetical protein
MHRIGTMCVRIRADRRFPRPRTFAKQGCGATLGRDSPPALLHHQTLPDEEISTYPAPPLKRLVITYPGFGL